MATQPAPLTENPDVIEFAELWNNRLGPRWLDMEWVKSIGFESALIYTVGGVIYRYELGCTVDELLDAIRYLTTDNDTGSGSEDAA